MPPFYHLLLLLHITAGSIALVLGSINMIARKGGGRHRKMGRVFVTSMLISA